jgi:hypothetical protein
MKTILAALLLGIAAPALAHYDRDDDDRHGHRRHFGHDAFGIEVLSSRPDTVSGGDALVRVTIHRRHVRTRDVKIELNGADVTGSFVADGDRLTGLVSGMRPGRNRIEVAERRPGRGRGHD